MTRVNVERGKLSPPEAEGAPWRADEIPLSPFFKGGIKRGFAAELARQAKASFHAAYGINMKYVFFVGVSLSCFTERGREKPFLQSTGVVYSQTRDTVDLFCRLMFFFFILNNNNCADNYSCNYENCCSNVKLVHFYFPPLSIINVKKKKSAAAIMPKVNLPKLNPAGETHCPRTTIAIKSMPMFAVIFAKFSLCFPVSIIYFHFYINRRLCQGVSPFAKEGGLPASYGLERYL